MSDQSFDFDHDDPCLAIGGGRFYECHLCVLSCNMAKALRCRRRKQRRFLRLLYHLREQQMSTKNWSLSIRDSVEGPCVRQRVSDFENDSNKLCGH